MSAQPVNGLTQFIETKTREFKLGGSGYGLLREFLLTATDEMISKCAQDVFKCAQDVFKREGATRFAEQVDKIKARINVFMEALKNETGRSGDHRTISESAEKVLNVLNDYKAAHDPLAWGSFVESRSNSGIFNGMAKGQSSPIARSDAPLVVSIKPLLDGLVRDRVIDGTGRPVPNTDELKIAKLNEIFKENDSKIVKLAIGKFVDTNTKEKSAQLEILILKTYASYLLENYYKFESEEFDRIQRLMADIRTIFMNFEVYTEEQMDSKFGFLDLSKIEEESFVLVAEEKPANNSPSTWFQAIVDARPDAVGRPRKTGGLRSIFGYSPYEKGPQYDNLKSLLIESDAKQLAAIFCETQKRSTMSTIYQKEVLHRFYEVFRTTEGVKQTSDNEVENVRSKIKLALEFVELKRIVEKFTHHDKKKVALENILRMYENGLGLLASAYQLTDKAFRQVGRNDETFQDFLSNNSQQLKTFSDRYFNVVPKTKAAMGIKSRLIYVLFSSKIPIETFVKVLDDSNGTKFLDELKKAVKSENLSLIEVNRRLLAGVMRHHLIDTRQQR